jgi:hypothetical protein
MLGTSLSPRLLCAIGVGGLLSLAGSSRAWACSCAEPLDPALAVEGADVVFEGRATQAVALQADLGLGDYLGARRFQFEVTRYFKGQLGPQLSVFTVDQSSACGRAYGLDEPHVVYARYTESGLLSDFLCSRSRPVASAENDLELLGAGVAPDPGVADDTASGVPAAEGSDLERIPVAGGAPAAGCAASLSLGAAAPGSPRSAAVWAPVVALVGLVACRASLRRRRA